MTFVEMTSEEWEEVRRHHDALVHMGELELQTEEIREIPRATDASLRGPRTVDLQLHELGGAVVNLRH